MTLTSVITATIEATQTDPLDLVTPRAQLEKIIRIALANGAGAGQANLMFSDTRTLGPSATENLDLAAGGLVDALGDVFTCARVKAVLFRAHPGPTNVNDVQVTRPAANGVAIFTAASAGVALPPGGLHLGVWPSAAGVVVTPGTADLITVTNGGAGTPVTYDVIILGAAS